VWPDQLERLQRLRGALEVARDTPATVDQADALRWLRERLARLRNGVVTVVFHSVVEMYLSEDDRRTLRDVILDAGRRATPEAPVAWLKMEHLAGSAPDPAGPAGIGPRNVQLTVWPGGEQRAIATASPHGPPVLWHA
jgi:hypothetical protein